MTTLDRRVRTEQPPRVEPPSAPREPTRFAGLNPSFVTGVAWLGTIFGLEMMAPPADPAAPMDAITVLLSLALLGALVVSLAGILSGRWWGFMGTVVGGAVLAGGTAFCFAIGHTGWALATQGMLGMVLMGLGGRYLGTELEAEAGQPS